MTAYADLLPGRRLLPDAYTSQPTEPAMPALRGDLLAAETARLRLADGAVAALHTATGDLPVPDLGDTGRHHLHTVHPVPAGWSPLTPEERQRIAPTWWAARCLHVPATDATGVLPAVVDAEVSR